MKKLFSIVGLAAAAALASAGSASAADMPVKAPPPPVPVVYDWTGLYVGIHTGYLWGDVHDVCSFGCNPAGFTEDSTVRNGIVGFHAGFQKEFRGFNFLGQGLVLGLEGGLNAPTNENDNSHFNSCAGAAFACRVRNFRDNWYAGGRLGIAFNVGNMPLWLGGDYLISVIGGWTTAEFVREDFRIATGARCAGGTCFTLRHDGAYVGASLEHLWAKGVLADWVGGIDYQHQFFEAKDGLDPAGGIHRLDADVDMIRFRTTLKFH